MTWKEIGKQGIEKIKPWASKTWRFLQQTFSEKKNIVRFVFSSIAIILTAQLMPGISIASFWVAFLLIVLMIGLLIAARPALVYLKLPFNLMYLGLFLLVAYALSLLLLDWLLWYFETDNVWWVLLYCLIQAVFNCVIENLVQEE